MTSLPRPRTFVKSDGRTLHPFIAQKPTERRLATLQRLAADDRYAVPLKLLLLALIVLLAALIEIVR